jgi:hypothetical protein
MTGLPVGRCRNCDAPVSYFARACSECRASNLPNPVAIGAALAAVLLLGAVIALGWKLLHRAAAPQGPSQATAPQGAVPAAPPASDTTANPKEDYGWIVQAMADCDEESKQQQDTLNFLIVPLTATAVSLPGWNPTPIGGVGDSATLLNSTDALIGLRNRAFVLYRKTLTFAVRDPQSKTVYKWKPAVGVTSLKSRDTGLDSLTLGFEIPDLAQDVEWGLTIALTKGTCYWINPLIRGLARGG